MGIIKVIAGLGCLIAALFLEPWVSLVWGELWYMLVPVAFILGLIATGLFLILKRRQVMSKKAKILIVLFLAILVASPVLLVAGIRHERGLLQARAKEFLLRPVPTLLKPNSEGYIGYECEGTNNEAEIHILGHSRALIERYATNGRIRWSARIQGEFASTSEHIWFPGAADIERTNQEVRLYLAERNAILGKEWRMGFWQWVEDSIEMKQTIPEIEEEDRDAAFVGRFVGTWTNENSRMLAIAPNGEFLSRWSDQYHTNIYGGNWVGRVRDPASLLFPTNASGTEPHWSIGEKKQLRIIHVDDHNLVYEVDNQTNSMSR
ncbi:MAG: hypothetical protein ABSD57_09920 [Verrucomicrobiota bacterium]|jgi:hypothetical protein